MLCLCTIQTWLRVLHESFRHVSSASDGRRPATSRLRRLPGELVLGGVVLGVHRWHISLGSARHFCLSSCIHMRRQTEEITKTFLSESSGGDKRGERGHYTNWNHLAKLKWLRGRGRWRHGKYSYRILLRTSSGSGGLGRRMRHIATQPATIIEVIMMPAASTKAARIIICDCCCCCCWRTDFLFFMFDVSAGVGSSEPMLGSSVVAVGEQQRVKGRKIREISVMKVSRRRLTAAYQTATVMNRLWHVRWNTVCCDLLRSRRTLGSWIPVLARAEVF